MKLVVSSSEERMNNDAWCVGWVMWATRPIRNDYLPFVWSAYGRLRLPIHRGMAGVVVVAPTVALAAATVDATVRTTVLS